MVLLQSMNNRVEHIDVARGISIFLVVLFHSKIDSFAPAVTGSLSLVRLPLFFFLSGIFFNCTYDFKHFLARKSDALLKPYFVTLFISLFIGIHLSNRDIVPQLAGIFYGNGDTIKLSPLWFLTHLFALHCCAYLVYRYTGFGRLPNKVKYPLLAISLFLGASVIKAFWHVGMRIDGESFELPGLPFSLDILPISIAFFILGRTLRDKAVGFTPRTFPLGLSLLLFLGISIFTETHINLNQRTFDSPVWVLLGALSGIYLAMASAWLINRSETFKKPFLAMGNGSLFILIFHMSFHNRVYQGISGFLRTTEVLILPSMLALAAGLALPLLIQWIAHRNAIVGMLYLPSFSAAHRSQKIQASG